MSDELRPLIYKSDSQGNPIRNEEEDGQLWLPTFNKNDISDYYDAKAAELNAKLQKEHAEQQQRFETRQRIQELGPRVPATRSGN